MAHGIVYLVGAGPGNPDLITVRGLSCLRRAQVVLYDRLVSRSLLAEVGPACELIYAGKQGHGPMAMPQEAIAQLLVDKAKAGQVVCRLKGGDPFVFGRGGEEAAALHRAGVPFEIVPGVTAGVGATAYAGIPVTHRGVSTAVTFVTCHEAANSNTGVDWAGLAAGSTTLVCYMGLGRLGEVRDLLIRHGRSPDTPAAVIYRGTQPEQQVVVAPLSELPERASGMEQPALTIIGDVVGLREVVAWAEQKPLYGCRVLLPFLGDEAPDLADAVRELGGEPWIFPRRLGGPFPHEVEILRQELAAGGIHQAMVTGVDAVRRLVLAIGGAKWLQAVPFECTRPEVAASLKGYGLLFVAKRFNHVQPCGGPCRN